MSTVRLRTIAAGIAEFEVDYGEKRAWISLQGLDTTGAPEEASTAWEPYYRKCLEELCAAIQAKDTRWTDRGSR